MRRVLFQAALVAARHNSNLETVARHLLEKGKPHKVSVLAIARQLIVIPNAIPNAAVPSTLQDTA